MNFRLLLLALLPLCNASAESGARELWRQQMKKLDKLIGAYQADEQVKRNSRQIGLPFFDIGFEGDLSEMEKTTVHKLRPQDVNTMAAMGDSLSAANGAGASTIAGLALEYRGMCFSIGGDGEVEDSITLTNIMKKFNPRIDGYSTGIGAPILYQEKYGFNVAVPGARADDMYGQAERLIKLLKEDPRSNFENDWKLLTLFIGGNDLCALGRDPEGAAPEAYVSEIERALDLLHSEVPRMFVNVVDILDIYLLPYVGYGYGSSAVCRVMQNIFCSHVIRTMNDTEAQDELRKINKQYQVQFQALIDTGKYDTRDDFTVVIQPFLRDSVLPYTEEEISRLCNAEKLSLISTITELEYQKLSKIPQARLRKTIWPQYGEVDATYFAPDCFHFSDIGHAMGAINLWNNMLEPVGQKTTVWSISDLKVPTKERPYFFTSKNSYNLPMDTTIRPIPTTSTAATKETLVPVWTIVVMSILVFLLVLESFILVCCTGGSDKKEDFDPTTYEKSGHVNATAVDRKSAL